LNETDVGTTFKHERRYGMPEEMASACFADVGNCGCRMILYELPNILANQNVVDRLIPPLLN